MQSHRALSMNQHEASILPFPRMTPKGATVAPLKLNMRMIVSTNGCGSQGIDGHIAPLMLPPHAESRQVERSGSMTSHSTGPKIKGGLPGQPLQLQNGLALLRPITEGIDNVDR